MTTASLLSATLVLFTVAVGVAVVRTRTAGEAALSPGPIGRVVEPDVPPQALSLPERLASVGYTVPDEISVYAAQVRTEADGDLNIVEYEAGAGAYHGNFWPASSVKVVVALGALQFLNGYGFSGGATVEAEAGWAATVRELAEAAIDESDNFAYDLLLQIAGVDWLNSAFLTAENGFPQTVIQRSYSGLDVRSSPEITIREDGREVTVPARSSDTDYGCSEEGNCSNLHELAVSIERVVLDAELPAGERLGLDPVDIDVVGDALLAAEGWLEAGVQRALGHSPLVYNKPGAAEGYDCVDVGLVEDPLTGNRYMLGVIAPLAGSSDCSVLSDVAEQVLAVLAE